MRSLITPFQLCEGVFWGFKLNKKLKTSDPSIVLRTEADIGLSRCGQLGQTHRDRIKYVRKIQTGCAIYARRWSGILKYKTFDSPFILINTNYANKENTIEMFFVLNKVAFFFF